MSMPSHAHDLQLLPNEAGGEARQFWPQLPMGEHQSEGICHADYPSLKKPRYSETLLNPRMPVSLDGSVNVIPFKTQLCTKFGLGGCRFGERCHFAHGIVDVPKGLPSEQGLTAEQGCLADNWVEDHRIISKLKLCRKFCKGEACPYGLKCHFLHEGLDKIRIDLGLFRKNTQVSIATVGFGEDRSGSGPLECKRFLNSSSSATGVYQKTVFGKRRPCDKWETTWTRPDGQKCHFANGQTVLQKPGTHNVSESKNVTLKGRATLAKDATPNRAGNETRSEYQLLGKKCLFKWRGIENTSRIYADWI